MEEGEALSLAQRRETPERPETQESRSSRPGLNVRVAQRETACSVGGSRWSAGARPSRFCREAQERKRSWKRDLDHRRGEKL
jgi:hypothetical protein